MKLKFFSINALEPEADQQALGDFCTPTVTEKSGRHFA
jgi:hypothetical protein